MADNRVPTALRNQVAERSGHVCEYCRTPERFAVQPFSVEHIQPRSLGGRTELSNLAYACQGCNNHKYKKTTGVDVVTGKLERLFHPREDE